MKKNAGGIKAAMAEADTHSDTHFIARRSGGASRSAALMPSATAAGIAGGLRLSNRFEAAQRAGT